MQNKNTQWHTQTSDSVLAGLAADKEGLTEVEAVKRLAVIRLDIAD